MVKLAVNFDRASVNQKADDSLVSTDKKIKSSAEEVLTECLKRFPVAESAGVSEKLSSKVAEWSRGARRRLIKEDPFGSGEKELEIAEASFNENGASLESIGKGLDGYRRFAASVDKKIHGDEEYWEKTYRKLCDEEEKDAASQDIVGKEMKAPEDDQEAKREKPQNRATKFSFGDFFRQKRGEETAEKREGVAGAKPQAAKTEETSKESFHRLLLKDWRKMLEQARAEWEIEQINNWRREFMKEIKNWLRLLQEMQTTMERLGLEPGMLFDLSKGGLSLDDIEQLKRWAKVINTPEVRKLCDMFGRLRRAAEIKRWEKLTSSSSITETLPDVNSKEEIVGVYLGRDIERALPQEKMLLADDDTALLFDLKYVENRLLCFEMQGWQASDKRVEEDIMAQVSEEDKMGPIIICVDTSGSMHGAPEKIAKAIAMFMSTRAMAQKRRCYLVNFSTNIETLDLSFDKGMSEILQFLRRSFHGGTDPLPAIEAGVAMMQKEDYQKSDLLMVSDFVVSGEISQGLKEKIAKAREAKNKFYALAIGDFYAEQSRQEGVFDGEWSYDPRRGDIRKLAEIVVDGIAEQ